MILCETRGLQLFWVIRGGIGLSRRLGAKLPHTERLMSVSILSLEPEHRKNRFGPPPRHANLGDHPGSVRCSNCLRFQLFCVETFSSLPKCQSNGRDLARQRQTSHLRLHALVQQSRVKIAERSRATAGSGGRALEDLLHSMIVILIQTTELLWFFGTLQLSANISVLRTVVRLNAQATIGPELPLAAEPVRGLNQRDQ